MKNRLTFSMNFGFGTLTKGIFVFPIADFRLPIDYRSCRFRFAPIELCGPLRLYFAPFADKKAQSQRAKPDAKTTKGTTSVPYPSLAIGAAAGTAGLPCGTFTSRIFRR